MEMNSIIKFLQAQNTGKVLEQKVILITTTLPSLYNTKQAPLNKSSCKQEQVIKHSNKQATRTTT
jgi:hypothetical protein